MSSSQKSYYHNHHSQHNNHQNSNHHYRHSPQLPVSSSSSPSLSSSSPLISSTSHALYWILLTLVVCGLLLCGMFWSTRSTNDPNTVSAHHQQHYVNSNSLFPGKQQTDAQIQSKESKETCDIIDYEHTPVASALSSPQKWIPQEAIDLYRAHVLKHNLTSAESNNILILTIASGGFMDFAYQIVCHHERLGIPNWLIACVDKICLSEMKKYNYAAHAILIPDMFKNDTDIQQCGGQYSHGFKSHCFNTISGVKIRTALLSISAGFNTLHVDADITFLHNPLYYMPLSHDVEMQAEPGEWCTGLYYLAATNWSRRVWSLVLTMLSHAWDRFDDQTAFNTWFGAVTLAAPERMKEHVFGLSTQMFPIGRQYSNTSTTAVVQHNNWMVGSDNKRNRAQQYGHWIWDQIAQLRSPDPRRLLCQPCTGCTTAEQLTIKPIRKTLTEVVDKKLIPLYEVEQDHPVQHMIMRSVRS